MNNKDGKLTNSEALYNRRKQAVMLFRKGMKRREIAPIVGVHRLTVGHWIKDWKKSGKDSLNVHDSGRPVGSGRKLLPLEEVEIIKSLIRECPDNEFNHLSFTLWTRQAVRLLIKQKLSIKISLQAVGDYLNRWGFTSQKPVFNAPEENSEKVTRWMSVDYPAIKRIARKERCEIHWVDAIRFHTDKMDRRAYDIIQEISFKHLSGVSQRVDMISTITNHGKIRFMLYTETLGSDFLIMFMERLIRSTNRRVLLILDEHAVNSRPKVRSWLYENLEFIEVFYFPSCNPARKRKLKFP